MYTDAELLDEIRRWADLYGMPPTRSDWDPARARQRCCTDTARAKTARRSEGHWPSAATIRNRFGSFGAAVAAAGLQPERITRGHSHWSDEDLLEVLRDVAYRLGRAPAPADLHAGTESDAPVSAIVLRFGSWQRALREAELPD